MIIAMKNKREIQSQNLKQKTHCILHLPRKVVHPSHTARASYLDDGLNSLKTPQIKLNGVNFGDRRILSPYYIIFNLSTELNSVFRGGVGTCLVGQKGVF